MGIRAWATLATCRMKGARGRAKEMRRQGPSEGDVGEGESREYKKGTSERRGSIYAARAAGPCEDANLTERYTRFGRPPFPDDNLHLDRLTMR